MKTADYWCTWATQAATRAERHASGALAFPGDQGLPGTRDNLDENAVFGPDGWAGFFPEHRGDLLFLLDDGWDVPYGAKPAGDGIGAFGSLVPDPVRFPPRNVGASGRDRLSELARRVGDAGWKGLGVWVACQAPGERYGVPFDEAALAEDLRRKIDAAASAGVKYWKVDWGVHCRDVRYRRLMSETKERLYPELAIEHCIVSGNAFNGRPGARGDPTDPLRFTGPSGRIFRNPAYEPLARECEELLSFADAFRSYDSAHPLTTATMLERAAWELECADRISARAVVNTEDEPLLAAGLCLGLGMMRAPVRPKSTVARVRPRRSRMAEDLRCIVWHRMAPPFGGNTPARTLHSETSIREEWRFLPGECWFTGQEEVFCHQVAPACVTRGLALPEVRGTDGEVPFVAASRHPNGALSLAALPLLDPAKGSWTPKAEVRFNAALEPGVPVGVFGRFGSLVLDDRTEGRRVAARDLLGGDPVDLTARCIREAERIVLPGEALAEVGVSRNPPGDDSAPGALVEVV